MPFIAFQSRNRGSFDFKASLPVQATPLPCIVQFQSRNRGSFDFKKDSLENPVNAVSVSIS